MGQLGQAEVEDLDDAIAGDHDVLGFQVPVDDAGRVGLGQPLGDLRRDRQDLAEGERGPGGELPKGLSFDELHGNEGSLIRFRDLEDGDDVGMGESGGGSGLALEPSQALGIRGRPPREEP